MEDIVEDSAVGSGTVRYRLYRKSGGRKERNVHHHQEHQQSALPAYRQEQDGIHRHAGRLGQISDILDGYVEVIHVDKRERCTTFLWAIANIPRPNGHSSHSLKLRHAHTAAIHHTLPQSTATAPRDIAAAVRLVGHEAA